MSLTTRCPACSTRFRVVPDQLKISDGWVRCGHCAEVFDAQLNLQQAAPAAASSASAASTPAAMQPDPISLDRMGDLIRDDLTRWRDIAAKAGVKAE